MTKGSGFKAPSGVKAPGGSFKQPPNAKGYLAKPKNYIKPIKVVRPEPGLQIEGTPTPTPKPTLVT